MSLKTSTGFTVYPCLIGSNLLAMKSNKMLNSTSKQGSSIDKIPRVGISTAVSQIRSIYANESLMLGILSWATGRRYLSKTTYHASLVIFLRSDQHPLRFYEPTPYFSGFIPKPYSDLRKALKMDKSATIKICQGDMQGSFDCLKRCLKVAALLLGGVEIESLVFNDFKDNPKHG